MTTQLVWLTIGITLGLGTWWLATAMTRRRSFRDPAHAPDADPPLASPVDGRSIAAKAHAKQVTHTAESESAATLPAATPTESPQLARTSARIGASLRDERQLTRQLAFDSGAPVEQLAALVAHELADLATSVQGNAQLLCEVTAEPELMPSRCEQLWAGVHRLRMLTEKLLAFAYVEDIERRPVDVRTCLAEVCAQLESQHGNVVTVNSATTSCLPTVLAEPRSLGHALVFVAEALLEMEPRSNSLSIAAYEVTDENDETAICIEMSAETEVAHSPTPQAGKPRRHLGHLAALRSLAAQGASLQIERREGSSATAIVTLEAAPGDPELAAPMPTGDVELHEFGGVLVLEGDSAIRSMIAAEVERLGRKILTSVDGASARALLEATPERFEMVVLEVDAPHESGLPIGIDILASNPHTKVLLVARDSDRLRLREATELGCHILRKPFGLLELRSALQRLLEAKPVVRTIVAPERTETESR